MKATELCLHNGAFAEAAHDAGGDQVTCRMVERLDRQGRRLVLGVGAAGRRQGPDPERMVLSVLRIGVDVGARRQHEAGLLGLQRRQAVMGAGQLQDAGAGEQGAEPFAGRPVRPAGAPSAIR